MKSLYKLIKTLAMAIDIWQAREIAVPVLALKDGSIIDGHTRVRLAKLLEIQVPVVFIDGEIEHVSPHELKVMY